MHLSYFAMEEKKERKNLPKQMMKLGVVLRVCEKVLFLPLFSPKLL